MATLAHRVLQNTAWRIEAIDCAADDICGKPFLRLDPTKTDKKDGAALERNFTVAWLGRGADLYVTDRSEIDSVHKLQVMVLYWPGRGWEEAQELAARDQWDIAQALRNDDNYVGISADDTTGSNGIISRTVEEMSFDLSEDDVWLLTIVLAVHMREQA